MMTDSTAELYSAHSIPAKPSVTVTVKGIFVGEWEGACDGLVDGSRDGGGVGAFEGIFVGG